MQVAIGQDQEIKCRNYLIFQVFLSVKKPAIYVVLGDLYILILIWQFSKILKVNWNERSF